MIKKVIKRDGREVEFDKNKIIIAILKAMKDTKNNENEEMAHKIATDIENTNKTYNVEEIQDIIEYKLMSSKRKDVAKSYILFREQRNKARGRKTYDVYMDITNAVANEITRENANMNADTPAGMMMKFASETSKPFTDDCLITTKTKEFIRNNYIHIHDKDYYPTKSLTCLHHPLDYILENGFRAGHGSSRPAKRIETASIIGCISMETVQNEMHGGQAIPAFDFYLAPYVRSTYIEEIKKIEKYDNKDYSHLYNIKIADYVYYNIDKLVTYEKIVQHSINQTVKRVHQAMEAFIHNMNTIHSRGGNQVVFSSINYGTDTSAEGRCIIREILNSTYDGVGNGETPIFPIQIWKLKKGVSADKCDKNYDLLELACKVTARRFFPNFLNLDAPFNRHNEWNINDPKRYEKEVATMGCRTRVFENRHGEKSSIGRGNLSFTTINLVKLGLECMNIDNYQNRIDTFFNKLEVCLNVTAEQLLDRYKFQCTAIKKQFPLLMNGLWIGSDKLNRTDTVESVLKHGTLGIGFIGLAECLIALTGKHHGESDTSQTLGLEIITYMRDKVNDFSEKYDLNYSVLATPAEGLSGRFVKKDRIDFGIIEHITDKDYYTNSNHVPVWYKCSILHKANIEAPYHELTTGGHIWYVELDGDTTKNPKAIMQIVEVIKMTNIGYGSINHIRNRCMDCGFENAEKDITTCPQCNSSNLDIIQRITGYLVGSVGSWNDGKKAELFDRVKHDEHETNKS